MKELLQQMKWHFLILHRNHLIAISVFITLFYALVFWVLKDLPNLDYLLTLLIYNDPALIGLIFIGVSLLLEKNEGVLSVWFITPVNKHLYLLARILVLSLLGWACTLGMVFCLLGTSFHFLHFSIATFSTCFIFSLIGIILLSDTSDVLLFVLKAIPVLLLMSLPLANYVHLTDLAIFKIWPIQGPLYLLINSYQVEPKWSEIYFGYAATLVWTPLLYWWAHRCFYSKIIKSV